MDIMGVTVLGAVLIGIVAFTIRALTSLWNERQSAARYPQPDDDEVWDSDGPAESPPDFF